MLAQLLAMGDELPIVCGIISANGVVVVAEYERNGRGLTDGVVAEHVLDDRAIELPLNLLFATAKEEKARPG